MKKLLRKILNKLGYDFIKVNQHSPYNARKTVSVKVAGYTILMPGNNPQISMYKYYPDVNSELGRLANLVGRKYPGSFMADIGANVGDTVAVIKAQCDIPIIAVEGDNFSFSFLEKNVKQFSEVYCFKEFLGEEKKTLLVNMDKSGWNNTIIPSVEGTQKLSLKTFDELITESNFHTKNIKLIKIDTEGFDTIILRGCTKTIVNCHPVIYFEFNVENMKAINEKGISTLFSFKKYDYEIIHIYDCFNKLLVATILDNSDIINQLHDYISTGSPMIPYYDICIFHRDDKDIASQFAHSSKLVLT